MTHKHTWSCFPFTFQDVIMEPLAVKAVKASSNAA